MAQGRRFDFGPFVDWGIVLEAVLAGGITAPIHSQRDFYVKLKGWDTLVRTQVRVKAYASIDMDRLNFIGVQRFIESEFGWAGFRIAANVFAREPNATWNEYGNREWKWGRTDWWEKQVVRAMADEFRKNRKKAEQGVDKGIEVAV